MNAEALADQGVLALIIPAEVTLPDGSTTDHFVLLHVASVAMPGLTGCGWPLSIHRWPDGDVSPDTPWCSLCETIAATESIEVRW